MSVASRMGHVTARVDAILEGLAPRDRKLLIGLTLFALVVLVGGGFFVMSGSLSAKETQLGERRADLNYVEVLAADYEASQVTLEEIEAELRKSGGQDLSAFLEKAATEVKIAENLDSVREKNVVELGSLEQKNYNVTVSRITQDQAVDFLYEVEGGGYPLKITSANFKVVKVKGEKFVTLKLDIAAYRLIESAEG
jgi:hypothetical protein